ncbi:MAG TPA: FliM/FliN family flagellar motor switch protein [Bryobacteraceae bacterium]|nr:FliM/FliN family flagellar motor switch protein [Bryobacteraceae bacterium]
MLPGLEVFSDVPVRLELRIGCRGNTLDGIARLSTGDTITLDRPAGDSLDLYVGDLLFGAAEVVVVEDRLHVRITDLFLAQPAEKSAAA